MADRYLLESSPTDGYQLEDGTGVLLLEGVSGWANITKVRGVGQAAIGKISGKSKASIAKINSKAV